MNLRAMCGFSLFVAIVSLIGTGCAQEQPSTIRVLSYNIHHGEGMDGEVDLERIARVISESRADLVALQEVDRGVARTHQVDQPARLAELTGMRAIFEKNIDYQGGEYGNAVLSRLPVEHFENHHLPQSLPKEQRGMLEVHVQFAGRRIIFLATHFDYHPDDGERMDSVATLKQIVAQNRGVPIIVAGDLNTLPASRAMREATSFLRDSFASGDETGFTFPADEPTRRIDYVLIEKDSRWRCVEHRVLHEDVASDHRPLLAVFETE